MEVFEAVAQPKRREILRLLSGGEMSDGEIAAHFAVTHPALSRHAGVLGEFVAADPPRRSSFTWGWEEELFATPPQSTLVEVSLTPHDDHTVVRLAHRRLKPHAVALHRAGWEHYLPRLVLV